MFLHDQRLVKLRGQLRNQPTIRQGMMAENDIRRKRVDRRAETLAAPTELPTADRESDFYTPTA
jgi:hypothetical protein